MLVFRQIGSSLKVLYIIKLQRYSNQIIMNSFSFRAIVINQLQKPIQQSLHSLLQQLPTMTPTSSPQDLSHAMAALQKSLWILIVYYKGFVKCILLIVFVYAFYWLGKASVRDERLEKKVELQELIGRRVKVRVEVPKRVVRLRRIGFGVLGGAGLLVVLEAVGYYMKIRWIRRHWGTIVSTITGLSIISLTLILLYKYFLQSQFHQNSTLQLNISKHLEQFQTTLGPKVNKLLKHHLCRQQISKLHSGLYSADCVKPECRELRGMMKMREGMMEGLVNGVVSFDWCSVCRRRRRFDEYLGFEVRQFEERGQGEEEEVKDKIVYLLQGIDKMHHWLTVTAPCNCSKLYWAMSTQRILQYKQAVKSVQERIKMIESKNLH